jgi:hypothetical protein
LPGAPGRPDPTAPDVTVVELVLSGAPIPYAAPRIDAVADVFFGSTEVRFEAPSPGLSVRYTLNGSEPTLAAPLATEPVRIWSTTTVTARTFDGKRAVGASAARTLTHAKPAPAAKVEGLVPGLVVLTDFGDRESVHDPRTVAFDAKTPEEVASLEKTLHERVVATLGLPEEDRARERVMLTFLGYVRVPADGLYELELESDDGSVLRVGDGFVLDNDGLHSAQKVRGRTALAAGWHPIRLDWFNRTGQTALALKMGPAGGPLHAIGAADLGHTDSSISSGD